jgi:hypothetical protein
LLTSVRWVLTASDLVVSVTTPDRRATWLSAR